jgi:RNA polymerase sigma-70 factor (ECF subfamily)
VNADFLALRRLSAGEHYRMQDSPSNTENLILLLTQHQEQLFRYIFSLVPCEADARDVLQETSVALFRKFDQYDATRPFLPWAYRFAYLQVQKHREKSARSPLLFSEDVIDLIATERARIEPLLDERLRVLDACLGKLTPQDKELVTSRYALRQSAEEMMRRFALSRRTLFRNLELLRQRLHECVTRQLQSEGLA